ncbi:MAG: hypothetical protein LBK40_02995 [Spirochaetaceae bacterium]|jgi:hypothetical protein|nr:hypothetical protein [Spirochaetaceae bacterium]
MGNVMTFGKRILFLSVLFCALPVFAADQRSRGLDVYVIFDDSTMDSANRAEAVSWLCLTFIDRILQNGDRLVLCSARERPEILFNRTISGEDQKTEAKNLVRNISGGRGTVNYAAALRDAARRNAEQRIAYTLLIGGAGMGVSQENDVAELLRYSKTDNFPGWKIITIGLGVDSRAGSAAASYMNR